MHVSVYWKFENAVSDADIDRIMQIDNGEWESATTFTEELTTKDVRKTDIIWNNEQWLYDLFWPMMMTANQSANWNLSVDAAESFQLGKYEDGGHYDFHMDADGLTPGNFPGNEFMHGKARKISMVCWLNDDFEGGEFEFHDAVLLDNVIKPTRGTVLFFPSWFLHKVHPVTSGTRYSLVTWFNGLPVS
jgi:PKHD-type hydroxylase